MPQQYFFADNLALLWHGRHHSRPTHRQRVTESPTVKGCEYSSTRLTCPLPRCKFDRAQGTLQPD
jgi:hypothetical protein